MIITDIIQKKKEKIELSQDEISFFVNGYVKGDIPDYQISALLMAICLNGMNEEETFNLTMAMRNSGDVLNFNDCNRKFVDKHSTGGVGDKTSLVLIPLVASCGVGIAKMSGRGLGHTGGTIDKLECFKGFNSELSSKEFMRLVRNEGVAITGQSDNLAPADKLLYALRDVTATVDSIPLIASSIMSKKLASGADGIVLDVTYGSGAFMKDAKSAMQLASLMVKIGKKAQKNVSAVISNMNQPLGYCIGNSLEVVEAINALSGNGPDDLMKLVYTLGSHMLIMGEVVDNTDDAYKLMQNAISDGSALEALKNIISAEGGDISYISDTDKFDKAKNSYECICHKSGYICHLDALKCGHVAMRLGAGRIKKGDKIDLSAGIILNYKVGDYVKPGDKLSTLYSNYDITDDIISDFKNAYIISDNNQVNEKLIYDVVN